jgi:hypothetical protein
VRIFFPEFNIRLYDKNSETDFFSLHQNQNIAFSSIGNQNICLEKNHTLPPLRHQMQREHAQIMKITNDFFNPISAFAQTNLIIEQKLTVIFSARN